MIVCPNCNHPNPDGAVQCEACYTPLPATTNCPSCGATVQADAAFCGQCGYNLHSNTAVPEPTIVGSTIAPDMPVELPPLVSPDPMLELLQPDALGLNVPAQPPALSNLPPTVVAVAPEPVQAPAPVPPPEAIALPAPEPIQAPAPVPPPEAIAPPAPEPAPEPAPVVQPEPEPEPAPAPNASRTQLQQVIARLFHVQSNQEIELPQNLSVVHIGKPNDRIPPDIDVAGFSNSEIVSRIHADIRVEGDAHYIEDVGSSNGTYINNLPLLPGNRHRLRPGDRISLGKGDLVTFLFQLS
ncbi:FHA domain-containing protein [Anabaena cylindrica FACHB-243]|uniref:FHA domain containing protein n=1 Tax=Anabaena cylindrica (strain ATCC 27899 / PCC 7122) TaxID=272123 RepID=K9ZG88_ANACC|nr:MULTISPECIES: FHA domain-containing protein [Anabaena]AFZ57759.1 FHA domain containing protein [Anabaena cylindrica PCC 7122]MBD2419331.1 FHA domain-containing protein [Anabaena cylindrica FACHB-243]MBY5282163.1 FHA domain-containing protein [Anabaena sp. CCAP 1446/1C]MBY5311345.1 FHA domain-containing protein [Anabaena sp. CCAP 1446/1C]MCM2409147.1 FHA domain-containing protein [Anabaena sp. CCAP 1446/1C]